jgi:hypothetical protein
MQLSRIALMPICCLLIAPLNWNERDVLISLPTRGMLTKVLLMLLMLGRLEQNRIVSVRLLQRWSRTHIDRLSIWKYLHLETLQLDGLGLRTVGLGDARCMTTEKDLLLLLLPQQLSSIDMVILMLRRLNVHSPLLSSFN